MVWNKSSSPPTTARHGTISCIVPHAAHVDHTEHDAHVIITEKGIADLRCKTPYERAELCEFVVRQSAKRSSPHFCHPKIGLWQAAVDEVLAAEKSEKVK